VKTKGGGQRKRICEKKANKKKRVRKLLPPMTQRQRISAAGNGRVREVESGKGKRWGADRMKYTLLSRWNKAAQINYGQTVGEERKDKTVSTKKTQ